MPPRRRFEKPKTEAPRPVLDTEVEAPNPKHSAVPQKEYEKEKISLEYPALGEMRLEKKQSRRTPLTFKQTPQRIQKRTKHHSIDSSTPSESLAITKCPWSPNNKSDGKDAPSIQKSQSFEETMKLEMRYKEHMARFSLDKADAEDRAIADLAVVYEIDRNPDERVSIKREIVGEVTAPVWSVNPLR
ncbi:uncharacterized protein LOC100899629 [Galendromus occidentalis]|uniref:Uncharacterized protein LOC100899629 n=1 Tax=Galendromus occidentalis TaxID=34638 RepID=A0AAJ6QMZ6_9ACAR|nr:uncharacterized protein LOC100899629 [Galendromus occidentalis]